jgi:4-carboxymuconolactone decarboxylase
MLRVLDHETARLVRTAAILTAGSEPAVRGALSDAVGAVRATWVEELLLQTYLFAGFPRALNATREWRRISGQAAPPADDEEDMGSTEFVTRGERTCATVYGPFYEQLRVNIRRLHPALDTWMISDGYGKVLGRPQLDLARRELCIIAACAVARQDRQLHSHLHGALHAGVLPDVVSATLALLDDLVSEDDASRYAGIWARVRGK